MKLEEKCLVKLNPEVCDLNTTLPQNHGLYGQCVPCRDHRHINEGTVKLRRIFYLRYYQKHCETDSHNEATAIAEGINKQKRGETKGLLAKNVAGFFLD